MQVGCAHGRLYDTLYQSTATAAHSSPEDDATAQQMLLPFTKVQPQLFLYVRRQLIAVHLESQRNQLESIRPFDAIPFAYSHQK